MDFWSKGLRGGDNGVTPRRGPWSKPGPTPSSSQSDKTKTEKPVTPGVPASLPSSRNQVPGTLRKPSPIVTDSPDASARPDSPSQPASVYSGDGDADGTEDFENDSVRVFVRVRPPTPQELAHENHKECLTVIGSRTLQLTVKEKQNTVHRFMFDQVLPEDTPQSDVFDLAGLVAVDNCLAGYNSSIFAYGQTGAGKTFTVIGQINSQEKRGLAPRVFDYLFAKITDHENARGPDTVKYNCRCAFLEIYNETIADLLSPNSINLPIREDPEKGPYVDGLSEPPALNVDEMLQHLLRGAENRHTGETRLNRESSRSHSVFMCTVEKTVTSNGISKCFYAKLNLVDLAGSERIASGAHGGSNATGEHFKEACHINKSLTALGRVTTELVKSQKNGGGGHVPYRDSKLTFLLQSSLGGNAKTLIIANVSPSAVCAHETLSTLRFAKQTKHIRNDAKVNWTVQGDRLAMQREIERLRMELAGMRSGLTEPLIQANEELTTRLEEERQRREELQQDKERVISALNQARRENRLLDQRLVGLAAISGMDGSRGAGALATVVEQLEVLTADSDQRRIAIAEAEKQHLSLQLEVEQERSARLAQQLCATDAARGEAAAKCELLDVQLAALAKERSDLEASCSVLAYNYSQSCALTEDQKEQLAEQQTRLTEAAGRLQTLESQLEVERAAREEVEKDLADAKAQQTAVHDEMERAVAHGASLQQLLDDNQAELSQKESEMEGLKRQLEGALSEVQQLQDRLAEANEQLAVMQLESSASKGELADQVTQLTVRLEESEAKALQERMSLQQERDAAVSSRDQQLLELEGQLAAKTAECSSALERLAALEHDLAAHMAARESAEVEATSLTSRLSLLEQSLSAAEARSLAGNEQLQRTETKAEQLQGELTAKALALEEALASGAATQQQLQDLAAKARALEEKGAEQAAAHAVLDDLYQAAQRELLSLKASVTVLQTQLESANGLLSSSEKCVEELQAKVVDLEARKAELSTQLDSLEAARAALDGLTTKQAAEAQDRSASIARLEARVGELESANRSLMEKLEQEQSTVNSCRDTISKQESCIAELHQRIEQEEARTMSAHREMSESTAAFQRQIAELEEQHLNEVKRLKDDLDKRSSELKARDQEMVRTNFELKKEIDRLHASLDQAKRELAAGKTNQEQLVASHHTAINGMTERLNKQTERYNDLTQKHDALKAQLDHAQREVEAWKTKHERLDRAMADVTRLIGFARNPPDSARSSLIMTRSDHVSPNMEASRMVSGTGSRVGLLGGIAAAGTPGSVPLRITESPVQSPRVSVSRYSASSPFGSKVGSFAISGSRHLNNDGEEWDSARHVPDVVSPGDQLPIPDADD